MKTIARMTLLAAALAAAPLVAAVTANAHSIAHYDNRIASLEQRVEQGRALGTITFFEGRSMRRLIGQARALRDKMFADQHLTRSEEHKLQREIEFVADRIEAESTDGRRRVWFLPRVGI